MVNEAKAILDRWATLVLTKDATFIDSGGEPRPNQDKIKHYQDIGYSEDIVLWIPPKDCLRMEFESTPEENRRWITEIESSAKSLGYDYCVTEHRNAKSPYFNMFNIKGIPLNEDNHLAKMMLIEQLCPSKKARDSLDKSNIGWTLSPVIGNPHWKPKYNGAVHAIVRGIPPTEHNNEFPKKFLNTIEKSKALFKEVSATTRKNEGWVLDFLTGYCLANKLPPGNRHNIIEKNLAIAIIHDPDRSNIERLYTTTQQQPLSSLQGWYSAVLNGQITEVNSGEIANYIRQNSLQFEIPPINISTEEACQGEPDKDGWVKVGVAQKDDSEKAEEKPHITLPVSGKLISIFASQVVEHIKEKHELFYRYREFQVQKLEKVPVNDVMKRDVRVLGFRSMIPSEMVTYVEKYVTPGVNIFNEKKKTITFKPKSMSADLAKTMLDSSEFKESLPLIDVIYDVPTPMLVDGQLVFPNSGYDPRFESWIPYDAPTLDPKLHIDIAKTIIEDIFGDFCFESPQDKVNAIAGLLTPFIRGLYVRRTCRTPIFFYKANRERAGKDYCAEITGIVMQGVANSEPPLADGKETHDDEFRKKILATFRLGKNRLHMSNNRGFINSAQLESISTNENFSDRILGSNTTLTFPNTLELSLSANTGVTYTPDLTNRCIFINLFLTLENPNDRSFKNPDLHGWVTSHRSDILSALYALVRDWYEKGMPPGKTLFASYPEWARVCGGIMVNAGLGDPCVPSEDSLEVGGDSETSDMKKLFELSFEQFEGKKVFKKELLNLLSSSDPKDEAFRELFTFLDWSKEHSARTIVGKIIDKYVGRTLAGIKMIRYEPGDKSHTERRLYAWEKVEMPLGGLGGLGGLAYQSSKKGDFGQNSSYFSKTDAFRKLESGSMPPKAPKAPRNTTLGSLLEGEELVRTPAEMMEEKAPNATKATENPKSIGLKDAIKKYLIDFKKVVKISDLSLAWQVDVDELCEAIESLKSKGEIMESPAGVIQRVW